MNPYVFFVGCPRSGTTLLRRMGDAHRELAVLRELHWVPLWWERRRDVAPEGTVTAGLVARVRKHSNFPRLELDPARLDELVREGRPKHYATFVGELFDLHGRVKGKRFVGEKTPKYVRHLPTLAELWPHVRIVHLIRDGRDVALSLRDGSRRDRWAGRFPTWAEDPLATATLYWEWNVRLGREAAALFEPNRYHELRYESLVADPAGECERLCEFLDLSFDPAMLRFHEGRTRSGIGLSPKRSWQPVTSGLRRWREQMTPAEVARAESVAGELLEELGYERAAASSEDAPPGAARLRDAFVDRARSLREAIPEAWQGVAA